MIDLLTQNWFEPPRAGGCTSQPLFSRFCPVIAQRGGAAILEAVRCCAHRTLPSQEHRREEFAELVRHLGERELLMQDSSGELLHGRLGEKFVNHYSFYASFATDEEFRIIAGGRTLGHDAGDADAQVGQRILFAGKTWKVESVDEEQKAVYVHRTGGGSPPLFSGGIGRKHTRVRQRMRQLLESSAVPPFLDEVAKRFLAEGCANYAARGLAADFVVDQGRTLIVLTWLGDAANEALACILRRRGYTVNAGGPGIEVLKGQKSVEDIVDALIDAAADEVPPIDVLLADVKNLQREKWDWALPDPLLWRSYASLYLDVDEALTWVRRLGRKGEIG